jgi:hypothetical protein
MIRYRRDLNKIINLQLPAVEVGVAEGYFSRDMLAWGLSKLFMVDNWGPIPGVTGDGSYSQAWHDKNFTAATERVKPFGKKAVILRGLSVEMSKLIEDDSLGLVYLDAGHSYEAVRSDLHAWFPKLKKGGVMAGHDYLNADYGVFSAVNEFAAANGYSVITMKEDKDEDAGFYFFKT